MKTAELALWPNAAGNANGPVLVGNAYLPMAARCSLFPNKSDNPKAPILSGSLELPQTLVTYLGTCWQNNTGLTQANDGSWRFTLPLDLAPTQPGSAPLHGTVHLPTDLLEQLLAGQGLGTIGAGNRQQPGFKLRLSVWRGDATNPNAPVLRGTLESPAEAAAYQASKTGGYGQPQPAAAAWGAPAVTAAPAPAPAAPAPAPAAPAPAPAAPAPAAPAPAAAPAAAAAAPAPTDWGVPF
jgi:hypothetical protein